MAKAKSDVQNIEDEIYSTFANIAASIGYSEMHGRIIGALIVERKPLSLQVLAERTGYSVPTISLSLDLLEIFGMIRRVKKPADRKLYVQIDGDILSGLKKAFILKIQNSVGDTLTKFKNYKNQLQNSKDKEKKKVMNTLTVLEKEVQRLNTYVNILSDIELP